MNLYRVKYSGVVSYCIRYVACNSFSEIPPIDKESKLDIASIEIVNEKLIVVGKK